MMTDFAAIQRPCGAPNETQKIIIVIVWEVFLHAVTLSIDML